MTDLLRAGAHLKLGRGAVAAAAPGSSCYRLSDTAISVGHRDNTLSQSVSLVIVLVGVTTQLSQSCHNGYAVCTVMGMHVSHTCISPVMASAARAAACFRWQPAPTAVAGPAVTL